MRGARCRVTRDVRGRKGAGGKNPSTHRPGTCWAISDHRQAPICFTSWRTLSSSAAVQGRLPAFCCAPRPRPAFFFASPAALEGGPAAGRGCASWGRCGCGGGSAAASIAGAATATPAAMDVGGVRALTACASVDDVDETGPTVPGAAADELHSAATELVPSAACAKLLVAIACALGVGRLLRRPLRGATAGGGGALSVTGLGLSASASGLQGASLIGEFMSAGAAVTTPSAALGASGSSTSIATVPTSAATGAAASPRADLRARAGAAASGEDPPLPPPPPLLAPTARRRLEGRRKGGSRAGSAEPRAAALCVAGASNVGVTKPLRSCAARGRVEVGEGPAIARAGGGGCFFAGWPLRKHAEFSNCS
eukprot:COSAG01_NODE_7812_length_3046_cov_6.254496_2_plen_368_part_00